MTLAARRAVTVAASLAAVSALAACAPADDPAVTTDETGESSAESTETASESASESAGSDEAGAATGGTYADGSYTATGSYISPGGEESVEVTLTLASDVVTDVEVVSLAEHPNSVRFQGEFIDGIADVVEGVPLDELAVDKVAGSSLTSGGFNEAVEIIKGEAGA
ncbi:hypothetical protein C8046_09285 [Serinibacter arcticus]|uniref:FMN-binding domain-containing protein n=1 Tax=Serinibacter arcticus TaxID=1655435 RepID=A0A2U1ZV36_9MICO|nr:FMN-binding protein [Serinibacter arcticus]PWD50810.1 hypothetical protein C8046_09285 [Serinibacter arcticus]